MYGCTCATVIAEGSAHQVLVISTLFGQNTTSGVDQSSSTLFETRVSLFFAGMYARHTGQ